VDFFNSRVENPLTGDFCIKNKNVHNK